jgi:UDP-N-acetylglucosamine 2-epimerase
VDTLKKLGYTDNHIILVGNPRYDYLKLIDKDHEKSSLVAEYDLDFTKKLIVIGKNQWDFNDHSWMSNYIKFCEVHDWQVVIKVHPAYKGKSNNESESYISKINKQCVKNKNFLITYEMNLKSLLASADLVITDHSNIGIEAVLTGLPLITVNFTGEHIDNDNIERFHEYDASKYVVNYNDLEIITSQILNQKKYMQEFSAGERIFNILTNPSNQS